MRNIHVSHASNYHHQSERGYICSARYMTIPPIVVFTRNGYDAFDIHRLVTFRLRIYPDVLVVKYRLLYTTRE